MSKKVILLFIGLIFFFTYHLAYADAVINEIMYDLDGTDVDWVEIYNAGGDDVDLLKLKLLISNSTANHGIVKYSGSSILHQGEFGIIVPTSQISAFISKWGNSGNLFTSSFTLPNVVDQETAKIEINSGVVSSPISSVMYDVSMGAKGDGNSLQLVDAAWSASLPTPGAENKITTVDADDDDTVDDDDTDSDESDTGDDSAGASSLVGTTTGSSSHSGGSSKSSKKVVETKVPKVTAKITVPKMIFTDVPFEFQGAAMSGSGKELKRGRYFWNFGDGNSKETTEVEKFPYTYVYEGDYVVTLEYYSKKLAKTPAATAKITVKVVPMSVSISKVGGQADFFIELSNSTNYEMDISGWILASAGKIFVLPRNSDILSKKKIILSSKVTNFSASDKNTLQLMTAKQEVVFDYGASVSPVSPVKTMAENVAPKQVLALSATKNEEPIVDAAAPEIPDKNLAMVPVEDMQIPVENLTADLPLSGQTPGGESTATESYSDSYLPMLLSIIFIASSAGAVYFIRKKNPVPAFSGRGDDFNILDE